MAALPRQFLSLGAKWGCHDIPEEGAAKGLLQSWQQSHGQGRTLVFQLFGKPTQVGKGAERAVQAGGELRSGLWGMVAPLFTPWSV